MLESKGVTFVVPVRKGSQRLRNKNTRNFGSFSEGRMDSLLSWKINQLLAVAPSDQILVSTNSEEAVSVARHLGVRVHIRDESLCTSDAPFDKVILDAASNVDSLHVAWAPATSPFLGPVTLRAIIDFYLENKNSCWANGLIAASNEASYFLISGAPVNFPIGSGHLQTQDLVNLQRFDWAFALRKTEDIRRNSYMFSDSPTIYEISRFENLDINEELDFRIAQNLIPVYKETAAQ